MGISSSSSDSSVLISASKHEAETSLNGEDSCLINDGRQKPYVETRIYKREEQPRSQLTCATQMTGWQSADSHDRSMCQQNNEIVELSRIISQLAMANHQLANVHSATLARMEALHLELSKTREARKQKISTEDLEIYEDVLRERLQDEDIKKEEMQRLSKQSKQRYLQEDKLHSKTERAENSLKVQDTNKNSCSRSAELHCESLEQQTNHIMINAINNVSDNCGDDRDSIREETDAYMYYSAHSDDSEINIPRLNKNLDKVHKRRARLRNDEQNPTRNLASEKISKLSEEVERLNVDRLEFQNTNMLRSLIDQKNLVEKLDYEESTKTRYETVEANLHKLRQEYDELTKHLDCAKKEIEKLLKEINIFQSEKDTADTRISILEQDLQKSLLETERIKHEENQKISELQTQLSEEVADKKKQTKALEDALQEIQRLKETMKTEGRKENVTSREDIDIVDSIDSVPKSMLNSNCSVTSMDEFKKELTLKIEAKHRAIAAVSSKMERLRRELDTEKEAHSETSSMLAQLRSVHSNSQHSDLANGGFVKTMMREQEKSEQTDESEKTLKRTEAQRLTRILKVSDELRNDVRYQIEKVDDFRYHLETDPERHQKRIRCLTEMTNNARASLITRERQTNELKNYLAQLLVRLGDKSFLEIQNDEKNECDRQLENINTLKSLYNERLRILIELKDSANKELTDMKQKLEYTLKKSENLEEELKKAEDKVDAQDSEITNLESQLGLTKADCRDLQNQMSLINGLFTQMLLGASSADMNLDRLTQLLQENHDLISDIAKKESTEAAALPKLLLDLIEQTEGSKASEKCANEENSAENITEVNRKEDDLQEEHIAHNLPKVWRVLLELLSCHAVTSPSISVASCSDPNSCYKSVDTPAGPRLVISVSKTYIRLKELILEKKHLEKEMNRMKQLNVHLESKLGEQEKRLSMVSVELAKTWNIVGRMQAQHQQLHTHEAILRYELQEKRKMLQELKQELEYCREKWESARQKNTNTEREWRNLRREFAARKALAVHDSFNSAESGFSDERGDDTDEEEKIIEGRIRHGSRRRTRKESLRAPTPDTESDQPTDIELSESNTTSLVTLEQRTSTPEIEAELDEAEIIHNSKLINVTETAQTCIMEDTQEILNPLDQALTNFIQNLIKIDDGESSEKVSVLRESITTPFKDLCDNPIPETGGDIKTDLTTTFRTDFSDENLQSWTIESLSAPSAVKTLKQTATNIDILAVDNGESSSTMIRNLSKQHNDDNGPSNRFLAPVFGPTTTKLENLTDSCINPLSTICSSSMMSSSHEEEPINRIQRPSKSMDSDSISVDSSSSLDTVREFPVDVVSTIPLLKSGDQLRESSQKEVISAKSRTPEEVLATRSDRLKRLEEQTDWLMKKMNATSKRGDALCSRLEELHETYGEPPVPPLMPDVLPSYRLPTVLPNLSHQAQEEESKII